MSDPYPVPTSIESCYETMAQLEEDIASIEDQIFRAKQAHRMTGDYADPDWYSAANFALKMKTAERLRLNGTMIRLRRDEGEADGFYEAVGRVVVEEWDAEDLGDVAEELVGRGMPEYAEVVESMVVRGVA